MLHRNRSISLASLLLITITPAYPQSAGPFTSNAVPANKAEAWTQIEQVIRADFSAWSGGDDHLTMQQVGRLERNGDITGQQAAALGLIGQFMVHQIKTSEGVEPSFTMEELITKLQANGPLRLRFLNVMQELTAATDGSNQLHLYGPSGQPTVEGVRQGPIGDCYALSSIEAVMHCYGPQYIQRLIQDNGGNEFLVSLPGCEPMTIKLTQAEIAQGNLDRDNGCWLQLLGIAMAKAKLEHSKPVKTEIAQAKRQQTRQTPIGALSVGGSQPMVMHWLTNDHYVTVGRRSRKWNPEEISRLLTTAFSANRPVGVCTKGHCLSAIGWDPGTRTLTLMNPWGTNGHYAPNGTEKFPMTNGQFTVTIDQLLQQFASVSVPKQIAVSVES